MFGVVVSVLLDRSVQRERGRAVFRSAGGLGRGLEDAATAMRVVLAELCERGRGARALAASHGEHGRGAAERRFRGAAVPNVGIGRGVGAGSRGVARRSAARRREEDRAQNGEAAPGAHRSYPKIDAVPPQGRPNQ